MLNRVLKQIFCWPMLLPINILTFSAFFGYMLMSWSVFYWTAGGLFLISCLRPLRPIVALAWLSMWAIIMYNVEVAFLAEFAKHRLNACFYGALYCVVLPLWCLYGLGSILRSCKFMQPYSQAPKPVEKVTIQNEKLDRKQTDKMPKTEIEPESFEPYKLLELSPNADAEEIKSNYRKLVLQYHPDRVQHLGKELQELAHKRMLEIQRAYEFLSASL